MEYLSLFVSKSNFSPDTYTILTDGFVVQSAQNNKKIGKEESRLVCPVTSQVNLGIYPELSDSLVYTHWILSLYVQRRLGLEWADVESN